MSSLRYSFESLWKWGCRKECLFLRNTLKCTHHKSHSHNIYVKKSTQAGGCVLGCGKAVQSSPPRQFAPSVQCDPCGPSHRSYMWRGAAGGAVLVRRSSEGEGAVLHQKLCLRDKLCKRYRVLSPTLRPCYRLRSGARVCGTTNQAVMMGSVHSLNRPSSNST